MSKRWTDGAVRSSAGVAMMLLLVVAGCGKRMGEVSGTVNYQGKPLSSGILTFFNKDGQIVGNATIVNGKYRAQQVPPGLVKITVTPAPLPKPAPKKGARVSMDDPTVPPEMPKLPSKYANPETSDLTYQVKPGPQKHRIELE